jgi:hypothetical protein
MVRDIVGETLRERLPKLHHAFRHIGIYATYLRHRGHIRLKLIAMFLHPSLEGRVTERYRQSRFDCELVDENDRGG